MRAAFGRLGWDDPDGVEVLPIAAQPGSLTKAASETGSGLRNDLNLQSDRGRVSISHYFELCPPYPQSRRVNSHGWPGACGPMLPIEPRQGLLNNERQPPGRAEESLHRQPGDDRPPKTEPAGPQRRTMTTDILRGRQYASTRRSIPASGDGPPGRRGAVLLLQLPLAPQWVCLVRGSGPAG